MRPSELASLANPTTMPAAGFETVGCPLCGSERWSTWLAGPDRAHPSPGHFTLVHCAACGLVFQNPRPSAAALSRYYPSDYMPYGADIGRSLAHRLGWRHGLELHRRCRFVARLKTAGELLDIGCATGTFLAGIEDYGAWRAWGIEPDLGAARRARAQGLDVVVARFEDMELAPGALDAVTLWDVLEHLPDPVDALRNVRRALRPDGLVVLNVPMLDSLDARLFGAYWCGLDLPRHLTLFDHATLWATLDKAGFIPVATGHPTGSHYSYTQSLRLWLQAHCPGRPGAVLSRLTYSPALKAGLLPWSAAVEALGLGASLTVAARPRPH